MYKHTYIQTLKLGSGEYKAGGQLSYSHSLQISLLLMYLIHPQLKVPHPLTSPHAEQIGSQTEPTKGSHAAYLNVWHSRPDPGLQAVTAEIGLAT